MVTKIITVRVPNKTNITTQIIEDIGEGLHYCNDVNIIGYCTILNKPLHRFLHDGY